ncbi:MAG: membrane protein insertase YidC [Bacteroidales bacterium]|nr:membrane protein insertase YidC [Bacteroidales bacterium]MDD4361204.1 membrane protein insertase YidC [Bacteroidales bacterium]
MDKNTLIGFGLILLILVGFSLLQKPTEQKVQQAIQQENVLNTAPPTAPQQAEPVQQEQAASGQTLSPSLSDNYGQFAAFLAGENQVYSIENDLMEISMASKGGRIASVRLKNYVTHDSLPLILFDEKNSSFDLTLISTNNRIINTKDLYFSPVQGQNPQEFIFRLALAQDQHLDFVYTLQEGSYLMSMHIRGQGLENLLSPSISNLDLNWAVKMRSQEKGRKFEQRYSMLQYKFMGDDVEKMSESKDDNKSVNNRLRWIAFKDQFFASVLINDKGFISNELSSKLENDLSPYIKNYALRSAIDFDMRGNREAQLKFYFGPTKYSILKKFDKGVEKAEQLDLDNLVPLGGSIIRWVNVGLIIPMFNFFGGFIGNFGIIIILMTICIKLIILPLTFKSYKSSAKMRLLKPQIDEINARLAGESKAQERSAATMDLYKRAGVNPMGGCLPMLMQFPILVAMFWFFPASIELRQESFLWAQDLSTYDAVITWEANIPLISKFFGNHISLFCLLMTITNLVYTKINNDSTGGGAQMPGMKAMMYLMPVMFLFVFNQYSSGLSFYYFVSTLFTIGQTYLFRATIDEQKMLAQLMEKKNKPVKKSGFAKRLEEAQRMQREQIKQQAKKRR